MNFISSERRKNSAYLDELASETQEIMDYAIPAAETADDAKQFRGIVSSLNRLEIPNIRWHIISLSEQQRARGVIPFVPIDGTRNPQFRLGASAIYMSAEQSQNYLDWLKTNLPGENGEKIMQIALSGALKRQHFHFIPMTGAEAATVSVMGIIHDNAYSYIMRANPAIVFRMSGGPSVNEFDFLSPTLIHELRHTRQYIERPALALHGDLAAQEQDIQKYTDYEEFDAYSITYKILSAIYYGLPDNSQDTKLEFLKGKILGSWDFTSGMDYAEEYKRPWEQTKP